jgi:hypothetical protein
MFPQALAQTTDCIDQGTDCISQPVGLSFFNSILLYLLIIILTLAVLYLIALLVRFYYRRANNLKISFSKIIWRITLPKESSKEHSNEKQATAEDLKSQISKMEAFLSTLGGLKAQKGLKSWFIGRNDSFSFEIVAHSGVISFYVAVPRDLQQYAEQQLFAQFSEAHIEEIPDYNIFSPTSFVAGCNLHLTRENMFPIKTYMKMEVDPLNSMINILSKVDKDDGIVIQVLCRSARKKWHDRGMKIASAMQQGKTLKDAIAENSFSIWRVIQNVFTGITKAMFSTPEKEGEDKKDDSHQLSPMENEIVKGLEEKTSKAGLDINIRIVASASLETKAQMYLQNITEAFNQYNIYQYGNSFNKYKYKQKLSEKIASDAIHRVFNDRKSFVLNAEELASVYHFPLPSTETPNILWLTAKKAAPPVNMPLEGLVMGRNTYRGKETIVKIKDADRRRHTYVIGKSGVGKSVLLANMAIQDVLNGKGICIIDPHGDLVDDVLVNIPKERAEDVIIFNPADTQRPMGMNLIEYDASLPEQKTFVINEVIKIFDKLYDLKATGGPMFEQYMRNSLLLIMDDPTDKATLMEVSRVLSDKEFRKEKLDKCNNQVVKDFWTKEAEKAGGEASLQNMVPYITSKLTQFVSNDIMRPIIGQPTSAIDFRKAMDSGKIILVKLAKGSIGEMNAYLLGMVIVGKILMAALGRTDMTKESRRDFYLYIDEFQNFTTDSIAIILSEARKYMLNLIIAHQYIGQLTKGNDTTIRDAVFGNVGTIMSFKIGVEDAETLAKEFAPVFDAYDVINVEKYTAYVKLLIDNEASRPFNMQPFPPVKGDVELAKQITELSRLKYGKERALVEADILKKIQGFSAGAGGSTDMDFK